MNEYIHYSAVHSIFQNFDLSKHYIKQIIAIKVKPSPANRLEALNCTELAALTFFSATVATDIPVSFPHAIHAVAKLLCVLQIA